SVVPDVCKTPMGSATPPVPYPVTADLSEAVQVASTVRSNSHPVVVFDMSKVPTTKGDEAGKAMGVKSNTDQGNCYPQTHTSTVRNKGQVVYRHDDLFWMNRP